jgi:hypothetical protein
MYRTKVLVLIMILIGASLNCGSGSNTLSGSVSDFSYWNLVFDYTEITLTEEGLQIKYLRNVAGADEPDIVASIIVLREGTAIVPDTDIDLGAFGEVDRFVRTVDEGGALVEDSHPFPGIQSGTIKFSKLSPTHGRPIAGEFFIQFLNGYTLNGKFSGSLIVQNQ